MLFGNGNGVLLVLIVVLVLICLGSTYTLRSSLGNGVCNVTMRTVDKRMEFSLRSRSTGWVALSLNKEKDHDQADVYFAYYGPDDKIHIKDCTIPKASRHIRVDANAHGPDVIQRKSTNKDPGIMEVNFYRKMDTDDVQDIKLEAGPLYMQCATGSPIGSTGFYRFIKKKNIDDISWTKPERIILPPLHKPTPTKTTQRPMTSIVPTGQNITGVTDVTETGFAGHKKGRFYDLQPILVLLTVAGVITSIVVMVVYCKCNRGRRYKANSAVAFYKGNTSWSDCSDEDDERMAFINDNKTV